MTIARTPDTVRMSQRLTDQQTPASGSPQRGHRRRGLLGWLADRPRSASRPGVTILPMVPDRDWPAYRPF